jgi:sortase A
MPENIEVLDPTPTQVLTLVTCFPFDYVGSAPKRFIVRATQTGTQVTDAKAKHGT